MAATLPSSSFSKKSCSLSPLTWPPIAQRAGPLVPFLRRVEVTPTPLISSSIFTLQISKLPHSRTRRTGATLSAWNGLEEAQLRGVHLDEEAPLSIKLLSIISEEQFDRIIAEAQHVEELLVILWMANWCRKCIHLKPKLEKLAADYCPRVRFYCVDVNNVPHKLVNRAGVTKMPTVQLWRDSKKVSEIIGTHKAWMVVNEVRKLIENED